MMFVATVFLTGGCGSKGSSSADGENIFAAEPNPVKVSVRTDDSKAVSAVIPIEGGDISATATDGTKFNLKVPAGALAGNEKITLVPVSSIAGLPLSGGLSAAVQLQPEGLLLLTPATLTIEPATPVPENELTAFGYRGDGDDLSLMRYEQEPPDNPGCHPFLRQWYRSWQQCRPRGTISAPSALQTGPAESGYGEDQPASIGVATRGKTERY